MWVKIILFLLLGICAVFDSIRQEIPLAVVWLGIAMAVVWRLWGGREEMEWTMVVLSVLPGLAFWGISFITGEKVGYGDGWMLIMIGLFTGIGKCFMILLTGLMLESTVVLLLLAARRISTDRTVPFAPFLLLGMGVTIWL